MFVLASGLFGLYFALFLVSCGSRKAETNKREVKQEQQETEHKQTEAEKVVFKVVRDTIYIESQSEVNTETRREKHTQTTQKIRKYYENGALKSEEEKSVTETEQISQLKEELKKEVAQSKTLKKENKKLLQKESLYQQKISELREKTKDKTTEKKESFWLFVLIGVSGLLGGVTFDRLILK